MRNHLRFSQMRLLRYLSTSPLCRQYIRNTPKHSDQIIVAMSSGVDSSVAASLYKDFPKVKGLYMANWAQTAKCTEEEWNQVQRICEQLRIPCERVNFEKEYWQQVFMPMIENYEKGLTPNPDLSCNKFIKFGKLVEYLDSRYRDYWLVTGHYSRIMKNTATNQMELLRGEFKPKDQSYYLSSISRDVLGKVLLPIGYLEKHQVRKMAQELDLLSKDKPDSMGLCFVNQDERKFNQFLDDYIEPNPGNIVTEDGKVWGKHNGLWHGTIGQKARISMPQGDPRYKGTWFIADKNYETNELIIVRGSDHPRLYKNSLKVIEFEKLNDDFSGDLTIQYRSLQTPIPVETIRFGDVMEIKLKEKQRAIAPGQNIVVYDGDRVLGSGVLLEAFDS